MQERKILISENDYKISSTGIDGLLVVERSPKFDARGFFKEVFRMEMLNRLSPEFNVVQMNHSLSNTGVIRGVHAERWDKFVYPLTGKMMSAIVDLRENSKTFGNVEKFEFDCSNGPSKALFLPNGMGNSICAIDGPVNYVYVVSAYWTQDSSFAINPFDPDLAIDWPVTSPIVESKDLTAPSMRQRFPNKY
jgi:dTDP-4-dehydrorhamnose 3,5-epimerase